MNNPTMSEAINAAISHQAALATLQPGGMKRGHSALRADIGLSEAGRKLMRLQRSEHGDRPAAVVVNKQPDDYREALLVYNAWKP